MSVASLSSVASRSRIGRLGLDARDGDRLLHRGRLYAEAPRGGGRAEPRRDDEIAASALSEWPVTARRRRRPAARNHPRRSVPHGRGPRNRRQQGDLAEEVARPEHDRLAAVGVDLDLAARDHVEAVAGLATAEDDPFRRQPDLLEGGGERLDDGGGERCEERDPAQERERGIVRPPGIERGELPPGERRQHRQQGPDDDERAAAAERSHEPGGRDRAERDRPPRQALEHAEARAPGRHPERRAGAASRPTRRRGVPDAEQPEERKGEHGLARWLGAPSAHPTAPCRARTAARACGCRHEREHDPAPASPPMPMAAFQVADAGVGRGRAARARRRR